MAQQVGNAHFYRPLTVSKVIFINAVTHKWKYYFGINNLFSWNRKFLMVFTIKFVPYANITSPAEPQVDPGDSAWHKKYSYTLQATRYTQIQL